MIQERKEEQPQVIGGSPWWISFYGEEYLRIYDPFLTPEITSKEVVGITQLLSLPEGSSILDVGCCTGRITLPLAKLGYQMTGLDLNNLFLQRAKAEARVQNLPVRFVQADMREIPFTAEFDAVISTFSSFGYFDSEEENACVLQQVHQALKPGGLFLLDTLFQPKVIRSFVPNGVTSYADGLYVVEKRHFDLLTSRFEVEITLLFPHGQRTTLRQSLRVYTLTELARLQATVGLTIQAYYGGLDGRALTTESRLVIISRKEK